MAASVYTAAGEPTRGGRALRPTQAQWGMPAAVTALVAIAVAALLAVGCGSLTGFLPSAFAEPGDITLPPGFQVSVYAGDVPNARQMAAGPDGIVFVGSRSEGKVYAVDNRNGQHRVHVLASRLNQPSGSPDARPTAAK